MKKDNPEDEAARLRAHGYMSVDAFLTKLLPGLREYLKTNGLHDGLHHPEDLFLNTQSYVEIGYHVIADFGVAGEKPAPVVKKEKTLSGVESYSGDAYCVSCKEKTAFEGVIKISDSGRRMAMGHCPKCGTKVNRILGKVN